MSNKNKIQGNHTPLENKGFTCLYEKNNPLPDPLPRRGNTFAFTLAETLITLVVIGVVAALTVPNLMQQYKKQEASARLKKFYSTLQQALIKSKADENDWEEWANSNTKDSRGANLVREFQDKYLLPYISYYKIKTVGDWVYIYLNDGSYFVNAKGDCIDFRYDVNGDKKPNISGKDQFTFLYCPNSSGYIKDGAIIPYQAKTHTTRQQLLNACQQTSNRCTGLLMYDGWEFKDDYPYRL